MNRRQTCVFVSLLTAALLLGGCSDQNAPVDQVHPDDWILTHGGEADDDFAGCASCHGSDFKGGTVGVSCFECHLDGPPFQIHLSAWEDAREDHQGFPESFSWTGCGVEACHGKNLKGGHGSGPTGPSCFTAVGCHADGPPAPHDIPYSSPSLHGPEARNGQLYCRNCHGREPNIFDGGFISDPNIIDNPSGKCSLCHPDATAHPTNWQGTNDPSPDDYLSTHWPVADESIGESCVLCHNTDGPGTGSFPGAPSCFSTEFTNADGASTGCHEDGPGDPHEDDFQMPARHGLEARDDLRLCQVCHGEPGSIFFDGGSASTACSECHTHAGAHPTDWQGTGDYSHRVAGSIDSACTLCHDVIAEQEAANEDAPSCFLSGFTNGDGLTRACHPNGPGPVHEADFADASNHGSAAKLNLGACQQCHGTPDTPDFDGGITMTSCAACHTAAGAHATDWQGSGEYSHRDAERTDTACAVCHDVNEGREPPNSAAPSCFGSSFTNAAGQTRACHPVGPGEVHAGDFSQPGNHGLEAKRDLTACQSCHGDVGTTDFGGGITITSCEACHVAAGAHATDWQGAGEYSHRDSGNQDQACSLCHDVTQGRRAPNGAAPSCFGSSFTNAAGQTRACHPGGPGQVHAGDFSQPGEHGSEAKKDLTTCQACHGDPGTPDFRGGITITSCEACHVAAGAHATDWQGAGEYSHRDSGNQAVACILCHDVTEGRNAPLPEAPSCFSTSHENADQQARACHPNGPGPVHAEEFSQPAQHGAQAKQNLSSCQVCHGDPGRPDFEGGLAALACSDCHTEARAHPTDWQGLGDYTHTAAGNIDASCSVCHDVQRGRRAPLASAPSCFRSDFRNADGQTRLCHPGGPGVPPHGEDGYSDPEQHGEEAKEDLVYCQQCHGTPGTTMFDGSALTDTACSECHTAAGAHATDWHGSGAFSHTTSGNRDTACALCHDFEQGRDAPLRAAPSCFQAEFRNDDGQARPCHAGGPGEPPHAESGYAVPAQHGADAKQDLVYCQLCHGVPGSPAFGGSVLTSTDCDNCHTTARAHPTDWQGGGTYSHRTAEWTSGACSICHDVTAGRDAPDATAPSCFSVSWENGDDQIRACHPGGPGSVHPEDFTEPAAHGAEAKLDLAYCQQCHGTPGSTAFDGGIAGVACSDCHEEAEAHPVIWQGDPNTDDYSHRTADELIVACGICHEVVDGAGGEHADAPSCFSTVFDNTGAPSGVRACHPGGPGPVHASETYADPAEHGPDAKADLTSCQPCHAAPYDALPPDTDPTFDVPNGPLAAGCESAGCHEPGTAHPLPWLGPADTNHQSAENMSGACTLCHELDGIGADSPRSCHDCHTAGSPLVETNCTSCHNEPPDGADPAGDVSPNRDGGHGVHVALPDIADDCDACHSGAGAETVEHYDEAAPADVVFDEVWDSESAPADGASYLDGSETCVDVSCHGGQETPAWFDGTLDVDNQCTDCHASDSVGDPQYNDYRNSNPGFDLNQHDFHLAQNNEVEIPARPVTCTDCHNTTVLGAGHFNALATPEMEGATSDTIGGGSTFVVSYEVNLADPTGMDRHRCVVLCHGPKYWVGPNAED